MKKRTYAVILAALVALMAASGASARHMNSHANVKQAVHGLQHAAKNMDKKVLRRASRDF